MKHDDTQSERFLTPTELAARWKISSMTLRRWRRSGTLKAYHLGRGIRFALVDVERIEAESRA